MKKKILALVMLSLLLPSCASNRQRIEVAQGKQSFEQGDYKQAFHQLLPVATDGNAHAQYAVGYMYYYGYGVTQDSDSGIFWMQKAAAQHDPTAMKALQKLGH